MTTNHTEALQGNALLLSSETGPAIGGAGSRQCHRGTGLFARTADVACRGDRHPARARAPPRRSGWRSAYGMTADRSRADGGHVLRHHARHQRRLSPAFLASFLQGRDAGAGGTGSRGARWPHRARCPTGSPITGATTSTPTGRATSIRPIGTRRRSCGHSRVSGIPPIHGAGPFGHRMTNTVTFAKDIYRDPAIATANRLYYVWVILGFAVPVAIGGLVSQSWYGALTGFLWGGPGPHVPVLSFHQRHRFRHPYLRPSPPSRRMTTAGTTHSGPCRPWARAGTTITMRFLLPPSSASPGGRWILAPGCCAVSKSLVLVWNINVATPDLVAAKKAAG